MWGCVCDVVCSLVSWFLALLLQDDLPKLTDIENSLVIFVMATYGEGDPTDNAHELHEWLQGDQDLQGINYAVSQQVLEYMLILS